MKDTSNQFARSAESSTSSFDFFLNSIPPSLIGLVIDLKTNFNIASSNMKM